MVENRGEDGDLREAAEGDGREDSEVGGAAEPEEVLDHAVLHSAERQALAATTVSMCHEDSQ